MDDTPKIKTAPEFSTLIPPLTAEERNQLKENLRRDGCRDPLVTWNGMLLDGYHRYELCQELGIRYETRQITVLKNRDEAKRWIIQNQIGRRNLSEYQRVELVLNLKPQIRAQARANLRTGSSGKRGGSPLQKSGKGINTRKELAGLARVSEDTVRKAERIMHSASEATKKKLRRGETSINKEHAKLVKSGLFLRQVASKSIRKGFEPQRSSREPEILTIIDTFFKRIDSIRIAVAARNLSVKETHRLLKVLHASMIWLQELEAVLKRQLLPKERSIVRPNVTFKRAQPLNRIR